MILSTNANLWTVAGMVYALAGAALLCHSVFLSPAPHSATTAEDKFSRRRLYEQWLDLRIGAVLILIGFFLQATGSLGTETLKVPAAFVLLGLAFAAAYYGLMKDLVVETLMDGSVTHRAAAGSNGATHPTHKAEESVTPEIESRAEVEQLQPVSLQ